jgi:hypothetical protein
VQLPNAAQQQLESITDADAYAVYAALIPQTWAYTSPFDLLVKGNETGNCRKGWDSSTFALRATADLIVSVGQPSRGLPAAAHALVRKRERRMAERWDSFPRIPPPSTIGPVFKRSTLKT